MIDAAILNEKELRDARVRVANLTAALSSEKALENAIAGLPPEICLLVTQMMEAERDHLNSVISAYEVAKDSGDASLLQQQAGTDPGVTLIVARIAKGFSQKELAWRLGVKEQQVQRYEADRYSSTSLKNYSRIAALLGVQLQATITETPEFRGLDAVIADVTREDIKKILKHGRSNGWFDADMTEAQLRQYIAENRIEFGSPSLLRTGLNVRDHSEDVLLHAWRARVAGRARETLSRETLEYSPHNLSWLPSFVRLSAHQNGPARAQQGIKAARNTAYCRTPNSWACHRRAAFLERGIPVIGMTIRRDTIDNFWFTLLHEIGHAVLHFRTGLSTGFYDQLDADSADEQEAEADRLRATC